MLPLLETPTTATATATATPTVTGNNPRINQHPTTSFHNPTTPFSDDFDFDFDIDSSTCSTPFVSAPSSPGRNNAPFPLAGGGSFYYSAPTSPMHFILTKNSSVPESSPVSSTCSFEFDFSARMSTNGTASAGSMSSADELFLNGQIRPMKLSTHLQHPQMLAPLLDLDESEEQQKLDYELERGRSSKYRDKSLRRRTRSMSPLRAFSSFDWSDDFEDNDEKTKHIIKGKEEEQRQEDSESIETTTNPSDSGASSRSSSTGRSSSKRWVFLKEFLNRSKSEGRSKSSNKLWSFSPIKEKIKTEKLFSTKNPSNYSSSSSAAGGGEKGVGVKSRKPVMNGLGKRRAAGPSAHELHYTARRAEAEEMRKKTFLPYRQGLLGCLGFSSKSYGTMHGFVRAFNSVSST